MKQIQNKFLKIIAVVGLLAFLPVSAKAACTNPAGVEGDQLYNSTHKVMQFCDDTNWISMKGGTATTLDALSCADGEVAKWNNGGGVWECATDNAGGAETDPTVLASVKDGVSWAEVTGKPAGFADGVDNTGITSENDPQVGTLTANQWCKANGTGSAIVCNQAPPSGTSCRVTIETQNNNASLGSATSSYSSNNVQRCTGYRLLAQTNSNGQYRARICIQCQ
ncbi:MAG: hypothetical protein MRY79_00275 [Alphaproteobacteria bacterium]|nr:hypothetical protein [Alphaproteobacteria bacterium]